jgi:hypothetical protein
MSISFFPNRQTMYKEVQQWITLKKLDMLLGLCSCCTYKAFGCTMTHQCRSCHVRDGILRLTDRRQRETSEGEEVLGVC